MASRGSPRRSRSRAQPDPWSTLHKSKTHSVHIEEMNSHRTQVATLLFIIWKCVYRVYSFERASSSHAGTRSGSRPPCWRSARPCGTCGRPRHRCTRSHPHSRCRARLTPEAPRSSDACAGSRAHNRSDMRPAGSRRTHAPSSDPLVAHTRPDLIVRYCGALRQSRSNRIESNLSRVNSQQLEYRVHSWSPWSRTRTGTCSERHSGRRSHTASRTPLAQQVLHGVNEMYCNQCIECKYDIHLHKAIL